LFEEFSTRLGKEQEELRQAAIALARHGRGNIEEAEDLTRQIHFTSQLLNDVENPERLVDVRMEHMQQALETRLRNKLKLTRRVSDDKIAEIVYRANEIKGERPFGDETAQAIRDMLDEVLEGDVALRDEILTYAASSYAQGSPERALTLFAQDVTGKLDSTLSEVRAGKLSMDDPSLEGIVRPPVDPHDLDEFDDVVQGIHWTDDIGTVETKLVDQEYEIAVVFDTTEGTIVQVVRHTDKNPDSVSWLGVGPSDDPVRYEEIVDFVIEGNSIHYHNHPTSIQDTASAEALKKLGAEVNLKNLAPSPPDVVLDILYNCESGRVVSPNGTMWVNNRPVNGWTQTEGTFWFEHPEIRDKVEAFHAIGFDAVSVEELGEIALEMRWFARTYADAYSGGATISRSVDRYVSALSDDLARITNDLESGKITKEVANARSKETKKFWKNAATKEYQDRWNAGLIRAYEEAFGIQILHRDVKRFRTLPPIREIIGKGDGAFREGAEKAQDLISLERNLVRRRIKQSLKDMSAQTQVQLGEIQRVRSMTDPEEIQRITLSLLNEEQVQKIRVGASDLRDLVSSKLIAPGSADADKVSRAVVSFLNTNYPGGLPLIDELGGVAAKSSKEFAAEMAERFPDTWIGNGSTVEAVRRRFLAITKRAEGERREALQRLLSASERLKKEKGTSGMLFTRKETRARAREIRDSRIANALKPIVLSSPDEATASKRVLDMLNDLVDTHNEPVLEAMNRAMADEITSSILSGDNLEVAVSKARDKAEDVAKAQVDELRLKLEEVQPRLEIPVPGKGKDTVVALKDWEVELWKRFNDMTKNLDEEQKMLAAMTALVDSPDIISKESIGEELFEHLQARYKQLLGKRFNEMPEELAPVAEELRSLIRGYEDMYEKHGMDFVKNPEEMMRLWGAIEYVPHILVPNEVIAKGEYSSAVLSRDALISLGSRLEDRFSTNMDQRKMRTIAGTMKEILNAGNIPDYTFSLDPTFLLARYAKATKAMNAQDFMFSLMQGKVVRSIRPRTAFEHELEFIGGRYGITHDTPDLESLVRAKASDDEIKLLDQLKESDQMIPMSQVAQDLGYVPMFDKAVKSLNMDLLVDGGQDAWRAAGVDNIDEIITAAREYGKEVDPFAKWIREIPEMQQGENILKVLLSMKADDYRIGRALFDPIAEKGAAMGAEVNKLTSILSNRGKSADEIAEELLKQNDKLSIKAWNEVAKKMNSRSVELQVGVKIRNGEMLQTFFEQGSEMWRLYVPQAVARSMEDLFVYSEKTPGGLYKVLRNINNFWKTRVTVMSAAFSARNHLSNKFSQMLDTGLATLSPVIAFNSSSLSLLVGLNEKYGSISRAKKFLRAPKLKYESDVAYMKRQVEAKALDLIDVAGDSFDLGDGVARTADEALQILREHGVISGAFTQYVDISRFEQGLSEIMYHGGVKQDWTKIKRWASAAEDALVMSVPGLMTGTIFPIGLPKAAGQNLSRLVENHARIGTFIANVRRTSNFRVAADHVEKFLFNYGDLTAAQKVWMRLFIPFFTWTQKNVALQLKMMQESPVFYSQFNRVMLVDGPDLAAAYSAQEGGYPYVPLEQQKPVNIKIREQHTRNLIRFPLPGHKGAFVEGFGLPLEPFAETVGLLTTAVQPSKWLLRYDDRKPQMRLLGQMHWMLKTMMELGMQHNAFYDRPLKELTNGRLVAQEIAALRRFPLVGDMMADQMANAMGLTISQPWNSKLGMFTDDIRVDPIPNYMIANLPWNRVFRDAAAASMAYHFSLLNTAPNEMMAEFGQKDQAPLGDGWRITDAMTGMRIVHDDPFYARKVYEYRIKKAATEKRARRGITRRLELEYPRRKP